VDRTVPPLKPAEGVPQVALGGPLNELSSPQLTALMLELANPEVRAITDQPKNKRARKAVVIEHGKQ